MTFEKSKKNLNQLVADLTQMKLILHKTHWYMRGANFLFLHPLLDEWMDDIDGQLDEVSERLITIGGSPYATMEEYIEHSKLTNEKGNWEQSTQERFAELLDNYRYLVGFYREAVIEADEEGDGVTNDLLQGHQNALEKRIWMLAAELGQAPDIY